MKILLDPVYTSLPTGCSTTYLMLQIVDQMIEQRDDVFFRLLVPKHLLEMPEQVEYLSRPGRMTLHPYDGVHTDRVREMFVLGQDIADMLHPANSELWDVDAIVSSRMTQLAVMRMNSSRRSSYGLGSMRFLLGLEEMPMFDFSPTVAWTEADFLSGLTLANYMAADEVIVSSFWAKREILQTARRHFAPSKVRELDAKIREAAPVEMERLRLKDTCPEVLNVVFCGRAVSSANFDEVAELFRKQFSFPLGKGKMDFVVSTNSLGVAKAKFGDMSMVSVEQNGREEFYDFLDNRAGVALNLSAVNDFSLSTYEMLLHGVPVIVYDHAWTQFLGPAYPFRAKGPVEAYAMINAFAQDYAGTYALFREWEAVWWANLCKDEAGKSTPVRAVQSLQQHEKDLQAWLVEREVGKSYRDLIRKQEGDRLDLVKMLDDEKMMSPTTTNTRNVVGRTTIFQMIKQWALVEGWKDTLETGVVVR